ncbi:MAG: gamma-glutamylcyclotransferase [Bacillota bacterium]
MDLNTFLNKDKCDRCGKDLVAKTMGYFNTDTLCLECSEEEKEHPLYQQAQQQDYLEMEKGNYYYDGPFAGMNYQEIQQ